MKRASPKPERTFQVESLKGSFKASTNTDGDYPFTVHVHDETARSNNKQIVSRSAPQKLQRSGQRPHDALQRCQPCTEDIDVQAYRTNYIAPEQKRYGSVPLQLHYSHLYPPTSPPPMLNVLRNQSQIAGHPPSPQQIPFGAPPATFPAPQHATLPMQPPPFPGHQAAMPCFPPSAPPEPAYPWKPSQNGALSDRNRNGNAVPLYEVPPPDLMDYDVSQMITVRMQPDWNRWTGTKY
ncbi:hypothetical protein MMC21_002851 [Puttea exsequens]|nr:hypothetical protein [Puttea exsequens]